MACPGESGVALAVSAGIACLTVAMLHYRPESFKADKTSNAGAASDTRGFTPLEKHDPA